MYTVVNADVVAWAEAYQGPKFHAMLTDTPYHLTSITERFGKNGSAPARYGKDGAFQRASKGFMGQDWDGGDVAFQVRTWRAFYNIMHSGAFNFAFAGSRGWHRMAVAIEDAGFLIHPTIFRVTTISGETLMCYAEDVAALVAAGEIADDAALRAYDVPAMLGWAYGSGFPKATRPDTTIDKRAGAERKVAGTRKQKGAKFKQTQAMIDNGGFNDPARTEYTVFEPSSEAAKAFSGYRYGGQALKPAIEPIICFQKPYDGDAVSSILATGAGALNIDGARVGVSDNDKQAIQGSTRGPIAGKGYVGNFGLRANYEPVQYNANGRWPANLILEHAPECTPVGAKRVKSANGKADSSAGVQGVVVAGHAGGAHKSGAHYGDATGHETVTQWQCVEGCPVRMLDEQSGQTVNGGRSNVKHSKSKNGYDGGWGDFTDSYIDDTGTASRFFFNADWQLNAIEQIEQADPIAYIPKASTTERDAGLHQFPPLTVNDGRETPIDNAYQRGETVRFNPHATVKPLSLTKYLATLLLPPEMYGDERRLFVPFSGVNSEVIGGLLAGWPNVVGVELVEKHVEYAIARTNWWLQASRVAMSTEPKEILEAVDDSASIEELAGVITLFDMMV